MLPAAKLLGSISRDRVGAERDSRRRVLACRVRRPRERHVAATRLTVLAEQSFPAGTPESCTRVFAWANALPGTYDVASQFDFRK